MAITHKNLRIQAERLLPEILDERMTVHGTENVEITRTENGRPFTVLGGRCDPPCFRVSAVAADGSVFFICRCPD